MGAFSCVGNVAICCYRQFLAEFDFFLLTAGEGDGKAAETA
jgi:hypothetical protein